MTDICVTVPMHQWPAWLAEGDMPGEEAQYESHFWVPKPLPKIKPGERVYIVAHGKLRGYAPLVALEVSLIEAAGGDNERNRDG